MKKINAGLLITIFLTFALNGCLEPKSGQDQTAVGIQSEKNPVPGCDSNGNSGDQNPHCTQPVPQPICGSLAGGHVDAVSTGPLALTNCAIRNGKVKCWGENALGNLGIGDNFNRGDDPNESNPHLSEVVSQE